MSLYTGAAMLVVALWVPGLLVWAAFGRPTDRLLAWAAAPAISLGLVHCLLVANYVASVPVTWWTYAVLTSPFAIVGVLRRRRPIARFPSWRPGVDGVLLGIAFTVGVALWVHAFSGPAPGLANVDASHHAWVISRIAALHTAQPHRILVAIPSTGAVAGDYAPLGLHALGAFAVQATHLGAARALQVLTLLFAAIAFPFGAFVLARRVSDNRRGVPGGAAVVASSGALFPWGPMYWSLIALLAGVALVAAVSVWFCEAVETGGMGSISAAALGLAGVFSVHNPEAFVALGLGILLSLNHGLRQAAGRIPRRLAVRSAAVVAGFGLLLIPLAPALAAGASERKAYQLSAFPNLAGFLRGLFLYSDFLSGPRGPAVTLAAALLSIVSIVGAIWLARRGQWALVSFAILLTCLICFAGGHSIGVLERVSAPWYHDPLRVAFTLGVCLPVFAAQGLVVGVEHFATTGRGYLISGATAMALIVAPFVARVSGAQAQFRAAALPLSADSLGAFNYLKKTVSPGQAVLNDSDADGSLWASVEGIPTAYGLWAPGAVLLPAWKELTLLRRELPQVCSRPDLRSIVSRYDLRYVLVVGRSFPVPTTPSLLSADRLDAVRGLTVRYQSGRSRVYEIDPTCR